MHEIPLPLTRCMRLLAAMAVAVPAVLIGMSPIADTWRLPASLLALLTGAWSWHRYRRWRPAVLRVGPGRRLSCVLSSGDLVEVDQVLLGILAPYLITASLIGKGGGTMALVVPGPTLDADVHWRLRRALLAWRPTADRGSGPRGGQSGAAGGT